MKIVYFSHVGNTKRFAENLAKHLDGFILSIEADGWKLDRPEAIEIESSSAHHEATNLEEVSESANPTLIYPPEWSGPPFDPPKILIVFPVYARRNVETGELEDTVPKPMRAFISKHRSQIIGAVVCGNRTFGSAFAKVNPLELDGIPIINRVELSGTIDDLKATATALRNL